MHIRHGDADDERPCWPDAAQIYHVDVQNPAKKTCVRSEATLPKATADNDLGPSTLWILRTECLAHQRYIEHFEELGRDVEPAQSLASIASGQIDRAPSIGGDGFERLRLSLPVEKVRGRNGGPERTVRGVHRMKHDQAIRAGIGQRADKHRVTYAEDRGVCPNTNRKAQHGDQG